MPITCPKCGHERTPGDKTPAWKCPGCGVAYTKVMTPTTPGVPPPPPAPPPPRSQTPASPGHIDARVIDIKMPFLSMVAFMVKWAIASIPAMLILILIGTATTQAIYSAIIGKTTFDSHTTPTPKPPAPPAPPPPPPPGAIQ